MNPSTPPDLYVVNPDGTLARCLWFDDDAPTGIIDRVLPVEDVPGGIEWQS